MSNNFPFELGAYARRNDPPTSKEAAASKSNRLRWDGQKRKLLSAFAEHEDMNADEAGRATGLIGTRANYWKRCSELRERGFIEDTGATRPSECGQMQIVSRITQLGLAALVDSKNAHDED
jgi:hypothetical protein